ncbi:hypothetical protein [Hymenobacter sp. PAMC 26628]|nr:hypothetical protein [Hymenobacter sp. PAMC 26628]
MHGEPLLQGHVRELSYQLRHQDGTTQPLLPNILTTTITNADTPAPVI